MEGKTVIISVLIMFLVIAQNQVEARLCCRRRTGRRLYIQCLRSARSRSVCLRRSGCRIFLTDTCPPAYPNYETLENSGGDDVNEYCNLGCESLVCGDLTNLENSDTSDTVNEEALEKCIKACSTLCTKGFQTAADQAELNQIALDQIALDEIAPDQIARDQIARDQIA